MTMRKQGGRKGGHGQQIVVDRLRGDMLGWCWAVMILNFDYDLDCMLCGRVQLRGESC